MSYAKYETKDGSYLVDWEKVHDIMRGCYLYQFARAELKVVTVEGEQIGEADLKEIRIPWSSIRPKASTATNSVLGPIIQNNDIGALYRLIHLVYFPQMVENKKVVRDQMSRVQTDNANSVNRLVEIWGGVIGVTKVVRDTSFTIVSIGAGIVGGPAGVALAAAASSGKGVAKYQDTHNIGSALIEGTASFITTIIPIGGASAGLKNSKTLDGVIVLIDASFDTTQNLVEGDSFLKAVTKAGGKQIVGKGFGKLANFHQKDVEKLIANSAIPITNVAKSSIEILNSNISKNIAAGMGAQALAGIATKKVVDNAPNNIATLAEQMRKNAASNDDSNILSMLQCERTLADLAMMKVG